MFSFKTVISLSKLVLAIVLRSKTVSIGDMKSDITQAILITMYVFLVHESELIDSKPKMKPVV